MLHCFSKSTLMDILEKMDTRRNTDGNNDEDLPVLTGRTATWKVSIIDAMAEVQALEKREWIKNCSHLADHFTAQIFEKYSGSDELQLICNRLVIYNFRVRLVKHQDKPCSIGCHC